MNKQRRRRWQRKRQKSNRFYISKTTTLLISGFFVHFLAVVHDYNLKVPNFKFCRGREHKTTTTFFFSWTLIQSFRSQLRKNLPTFDELTDMVWTRSSLRQRELVSRRRRCCLSSLIPGAGYAIKSLGVLPMMTYTGRLRPKGVPLSGFRYMKRYVFHHLNYLKG